MAQGRRSKKSEAANDDEDRADVVDEKLVDDAVEWLRDKVAETVTRGMVEIGDYLFDAFFGGDAERVRSKAPNKNASFRALVERCETTELPLRRSALHAAVSTAVMRRLLPEGADAYPQLPPSHQAALLPLRDPKKVEKVAQRALSKGLSVRDLKEVVGEEVAAAAPADGERRGRPPKPIIMKTLERSLKVFTLESGRRSFTKAHLDELSDDDAKKALSEARALAASLEKLIEKLEARA